VFRGITEQMVAVSMPLRSLLEFLSQRGNPKLHEQFVRITEDVHDQVFGPEIEQKNHRRRNTTEIGLAAELSPIKQKKRKVN